MGRFCKHEQKPSHLGSGKHKRKSSSFLKIRIIDHLDVGHYTCIQEMLSDAFGGALASENDLLHFCYELAITFTSHHSFISYLLLQVTQI